MRFNNLRLWGRVLITSGIILLLIYLRLGALLGVFAVFVGLSLLDRVEREEHWRLNLKYFSKTKEDL
jgi:hypothetical protein